LDVKDTSIQELSKLSVVYKLACCIVGFFEAVFKSAICKLMVGMGDGRNPEGIPGL
jgi:hypothetical protein